MSVATGPGVIKCDKASIVFATGEGIRKTKALANRVAWIKESVELGEVSVEYIPTREPRADALTKNLSGPLHRNGVASLTLSPLIKPDTTLNLCRPGLSMHRPRLCRMVVDDNHGYNTDLDKRCVW